MFVSTFKQNRMVYLKEKTQTLELKYQTIVHALRGILWLVERHTENPCVWYIVSALREVHGWDAHRGQREQLLQGLLQIVESEKIGGY